MAILTDLRLPTILVDQDGVQANLMAGIVRDMRKYFPKFEVADVENQVNFNVFLNQPQEVCDALAWVMDRPGFYASLEPIDGVGQAMNEMLDAGYDVAICTAPWKTNPTCVQDKLEWIDKYLGNRWRERMVISRDKTRVRGDLLIDDKPKITGLHVPLWRQAYFTQPYNMMLTDKPHLVRWADWPDLLTKFDFSSLVG